MSTESNANGRVKIYLDNETGLNYIKGVTKVLFENGVVVKRSDFDNRVMNNRTVTGLIVSAKQNPDNCGWDFRNACNTANLERQKGWRPVVKPKEQPRVEVSRKEAVKAPELPSVPITQQLQARISRMREFFSAPHADIIVIATTIGIACAFMSMYHAFTFLHDVNGKPAPIAFITAFTMVLFASSAFTIARHLGSDRKIGLVSRLVLSPTFVALGIGVVWFLVFSTVTVNYEQFRARDTEREEQFIAKDASVNTTNAEITAKEAEIASATSDVDRYSKENDTWYSEYSKALPNEAPSEDPAVQKQIASRLYAATIARNKAFELYEIAQANLSKSVAKRDRLMGEKAALLAKTGTAVDTAKANRETAYTVVASKTGIAESTLQFLVYVIPPTFFDIVSPVTLSVVLLLRDRRRDKSEEKESLLSRFKKWLVKTGKKGE